MYLFLIGKRDFGHLRELALSFLCESLTDSQSQNNQPEPIRILKFDRSV
jgi:hypothetical protein